MIYTAAYCGHDNIIEDLTKRAKDSDIPINTSNVAMIAAQCGHRRLVKKLINKDENSALAGHKETVDLITAMNMIVILS